MRKIVSFVFLYSVWGLVELSLVVLLVALVFGIVGSVGCLRAEYFAKLRNIEVVFKGKFSVGTAVKFVNFVGTSSGLEIPRNQTKDAKKAL